MDQRLAITSDPQALLQYLKDVYTMEKNLYCSRNAEANMQRTIESDEGYVRQLRQQKSLSFPSYFDYATTHAGEYRLLAAMGLGVLGLLVSGLMGWFDWYGLWPTILFAVSPYLLLIAGYLLECMRFILNFGGEQAYIKKQNEDNKATAEKYLNVTIPMNKATKQLYTDNIHSCQTALQKLYSLDVIFPKYRNLVAVAQIYEYIAAGRCFTLEGPDGAYNLYESELRQNIIISQLDKITRVLEEIRDTQYMICSAIQESNRLLQQVANNTAATAYNSSVIAFNTSAMLRYG